MSSGWQRRKRERMPNENKTEKRKRRKPCSGGDACGGRRREEQLSSDSVLVKEPRQPLEGTTANVETAQKSGGDVGDDGCGDNEVVAWRGSLRSWRFGLGLEREKNKSVKEAYKERMAELKGEKRKKVVNTKAGKMKGEAAEKQLKKSAKEK